MSNKKEVGLVLSCMDYRLIDHVVNFLKKDVHVDAFDFTVLAGASLGYNQTKYITWPISFKNHVDLAIKLHQIRKIVVIDHEDCGAYKAFYPTVKNNIRKEDEYHVKNIKKFIKDMKKIYPNLIYSGYLMRLDGKVMKVV